MKLSVNSVMARSWAIMLLAGVSGVSSANPLIDLELNREEARRMAVTHGLTGRASLPPGISKRLAEGKPLPPGIAKQVVPGPMLRDLPEIAGHEWRVAGDDLILVALATMAVVEILDDVFG